MNVYLYLPNRVSLWKKKLQIRIGKSPKKDRRDLFRPVSEDFIDMNHELVLSANKIEWSYFGKEPGVYYSDKGAPGVLIRMPAGCMLLKHLYNSGEERLPEYGVRDVCFRYFSGSVFFEHKFPFDPSDFVHSRDRIRVREGGKGKSLPPV